MKSWCLKDKLTGNVFKVFLTEEKLNEYFEKNPNIKECVNCVECYDAPSILMD